MKVLSQVVAQKFTSRERNWQPFFPFKILKLLKGKT